MEHDPGSNLAKDSSINITTAIGKPLHSITNKAGNNPCFCNLCKNMLWTETNLRKVPHLIENGLKGDGEGHNWVRTSPVGRLVGLAEVVAVQHRARPAPLLERHRLLGKLEHQ